MKNIAIIKQKYSNLKFYGLFDNSEFLPGVITSKIKLKAYKQDKSHPCTYHRLTLYGHKREVFSQKDSGCHIHFLNTGKGDSFVIENCGKYALIDFGSQKKKTQNFLDQKLPTKNIDYAIITHFHADHMSDFQNVMENYHVKNLIAVKNIPRFGKDAESEEYTKFDKYCNASTVTLLNIEDCITNHSHNFFLGNAEFEFLGPIKNLDNLNNNSIVLKMNYKDISVLFTGDITTVAEEKIMKYCKERNISLKSTILKVAHHGSRESTSDKFLNKVNPSISVIACSKENSSRHPHDETIKKLEKTCLLKTYEHDISIDIKIDKDNQITIGDLLLPNLTKRLPYSEQEWKLRLDKMYQDWKKENTYPITEVSFDIDNFTYSN